MTNQIFKSAILDFSVSAQNAKANVPQIKFSTQDSGGTARLVFMVKKDDNYLPLSSAAEVTLAMIMSVGKKYESKYVVNPEIINRTEGVFEYSLTDDQISHDGQVNAELYVKYPNQSMQINRFKFDIEKAMIDDDFLPVATYYVEKWDDYEKIFNEKVDLLQSEIDGLQSCADNLQVQFDNMQPNRFLEKSGGILTGSLQFDGVPTIFQAKQNNAWWYRLTSENSTTYQQSLYPAIVSGINGVQGAGYNFKQTYLRLNGVDVETIAGAQTKATKALTDAKIYSDSLLDSYGPWVNVPLASGYTTGDSNPPQYRLKQIHTNEGVKTFVEFQGAIAGTFVSTSNTTVATMPAGARPGVTYYRSVASNNGNGGRIAIPTDGKVLQVSSTDNANPTYVGLSEICYEVGN
ncbi:Gp20 [Listeria monocytogenes]|uniref:phage baseplate upper protein n=1 Tax=Listeria monocytogenes TaxID=1639 RepID=UPI00074D67E7|nr:phage baseplate upper protein [Listeria monocytogenes]CUK85924.1 Gp20 [Listeria monocytogenes]